MKPLATAFILTVLISLVFIDASLARDLVEAAQSAQSQFNKIGVAAISIGLTVGGILFAAGFPMQGRILLMSGFVGAIAVLGAPAIISLIGRIFGASL